MYDPGGKSDLFFWPVEIGLVKKYALMSEYLGPC